MLNCKITSAAVQKKEEAELAMSFDLAAMLVVKLKSGVSLQKMSGNIFHISFSMAPCQEARKKREEKEARKLHHHSHLASTGFRDMFPSDVHTMASRGGIN